MTKTDRVTVWFIILEAVLGYANLFEAKEPKMTMAMAAVGLVLWCLLPSATETT